MRSEAVHTHFRCNQGCTFCNVRRPKDEPSFIAATAVRGRIEAALGAGAAELWFTGGEPTMRQDLESLVEHARARGAKRIGLETNATLVDAARAQALGRAGVDVVRVHLPGWGADADAVTRDPGGFEAAERGLDALLGAGLSVELAAPVVRSTARGLPGLPRRVRERFAGVRALVLSVPVSSPDATELLSYEEAAAVIVGVAASGREVGLTVKLHPATSPPPCVFAPNERPSHLFSLTPGARPRTDCQQVEACRTCQVADRCSGFSREYLARRAVPLLHPVGDDRARRRLSLIDSVEQQIEREIVTPNLYKAPDGSDVLEDVVRVNFHCNQSCRFCFVSTHLPEPGDARVRAAIEDAARRDVRITLSGGEPTLNPRLLEYVALAKRLSRRPLQLQSNAVRLADPALTRALADAGLDEVFISLHGSTAEVSDAVTNAPGTFERTVLGLDELAKTRIRLIINFVICERNLHDVVPFVRLVGSRWPRAFVNLSFVAPSTDVVPRDREMIPRYADALPQIDAAIAEARALGLELGGFESMCGVPLCLVPTSLERFLSFAELPPGFDRGEFVKAEACSGCALEQRCYGIRRGYVALHGAGELRRISLSPQRPRSGNIPSPSGRGPG